MEADGYWFIFREGGWRGERERGWRGEQNNSNAQDKTRVGLFNVLLCPLGNPKKHVAALKKALDSTCVGEPSLYNSLTLAMQTLKYEVCLCNTLMLCSLHVCLFQARFVSADTCLATPAGRF